MAWQTDNSSPWYTRFKNVRWDGKAKWDDAKVVWDATGDRKWQNDNSNTWYTKNS